MVASFGGTYQESQRKAFFEPFAADHGVTIVEGSTEYGKLRTKAEQGDTEIDVADVETFYVFQASEQNTLEPIPADLIPVDDLLPGSVHEFGVANCVWSTVLAWNTDAVGDPTPASWADLWDLEKFPGKRALRDAPQSTLEVALLADGVALDALYPLDVDRAFAALDRIKDHVVWWSSGHDAPRLLSSGEVTLAAAWNGRVHDAAQDGQAIAYTWNQGLMDCEWWVIPKGAPNAERAREFIRFALSPEAQANQPQHIAYGPTNKLAIAQLSEEVLANLPTAPQNLAVQTRLDAQWWAEHEAEVTERWSLWKVR
ncbi:ABC transporter substrate-binding protein [Planctomycetota bacterium]|nr:ABC transporter substrate-binding protein [Planctomycetota bacterium]